LPTDFVSAVVAAPAEQRRNTRDNPLYDGTGWSACRRQTVASLARAESALAGPAVLEDYTTTVVVPAGWTASVDGQSNLILANGV
jgi:N-methylhydantoinase A